MSFPWDQYVKLRSAMDSVDGTLLLSINDHPDIRTLFADVPMVELNQTYSVGGGGKEKHVTELLFGNWPAGVPQGKGAQSGLF